MTQMNILIISTMLLLVYSINCEDCQNPKYAETSHFDDIYLIHQINQVPVTVYTCTVIINGSYRLYKDDCIQSFRTGVKFIYEARKYYNIKVNDTVQYSEKVVKGAKEQQLNISITLREYIAEADLTENEMKLKSGVICRYNLGKCFDDTESSEAAWDPSTTGEKNISDFYRIPLKSTTSYVVTLKRNPLIQYAIIDRENTTFALQLLKRDKYGRSNIWHTNVHGFKVAFKSENFDELFNTLSTVDPFLKREITLDLQPKELVYSLIMNTCNLQSRLEEANNSITPSTKTEVSDKLKRHVSVFDSNIENAIQENLHSKIISDSTVVQLSDENVALIILICSIIALILIYALYNIILNCFILQNIADGRPSRGRNYMWYSVSQGLTIRYIYETLHREINILKIKFSTSRKERLDSEISQRNFSNGYENPYERPLSSDYTII